MLQPVVSASVPSLGLQGKPLQEIFSRVRHSLVEFTAHDIYQICGCALNMDTIGMMQDGEFMRGLSSAFQRIDQSVLSPFQTNLITDVFFRAGINVAANELAVPEEDAISPESLIAVLKAMTVTKTRNENRLAEVLKHIINMIDEFSPNQLVTAISELSLLKCTDTFHLSKMAQKVFDSSDDISAMEVGVLALALSYCPNTYHGVLLQMFDLVSKRCVEFLPEDFVRALQALNATGVKFQKTLIPLVEAGIQNVENLDGVTLTNFLVCFVSLDYRNREHIEIFGDALIEKCTELGQKDLVQVMQACLRLGLMTGPVFNILGGCAVHYAGRLEPRNLIPVIDVCSQVTFNSDVLMAALLDRCVECVRVLSSYQFGEVLELIGTYPPAKAHSIVEIFGKHARVRMDLLGPEPLAMATKGLANLGFADQEFYIDACESAFRWGFKDFSQLEPILQGLCITAQVHASMVKILGLHLIPMTFQMSIQEVERANRYMCRLNSEDEHVYKALADRVRVFVREISPEMPQDLQLLLQRGAALV